MSATGGWYTGDRLLALNKAGATGWTGSGPGLYSAPPGPLAQLVEQGTLNPKVEGSNPSRPIPYAGLCRVRGSDWPRCAYLGSTKSQSSFSAVNCHDERLHAVSTDRCSVGACLWGEDHPRGRPQRPVRFSNRPDEVCTSAPPRSAPDKRSHRQVLQQLGNELDAETRGSWVADAVREVAASTDGTVVVDAVRTSDQVDALRNIGETLHIHVTAAEADLKARYAANTSRTWIAKPYG
jgi:hypothetical protein